jgi:hypothetical protein
LDLKSLMCDRYVQFCCHDFGMNVHILFSLFTTDSKYAKLTTPSNLKISYGPILKVYSTLCRKHFHVLSFLSTDS